MRLVLLLAALILWQATPDRWRLVSTARQSRIYADDARAERGRADVRRWEKIVLRRDTREGRAARNRLTAILADEVGRERAARHGYMLALREYRCEEGEARAFEVVYYDDAGRVIYRQQTPGRWESPPPESQAETAMRDACARPIEMQ